ncbi:adenosylcobinamide-phosphate synthase CbiB [Psychromonas hadalis]|uniref:adenosylcobinamide-phosphate synthase CbiB n=1 Tax=Psychromonas hadalis TaxID=211669 RepID=UPI0003B43EB2|nr:adenosylcobinamide-phosphate synthase CbiB [Psychromonas hadalis]
MMITVTLISALIIDHLFGEPIRFHPLVLFGKIAKKLERKLNHGSKTTRFLGGIVAWSLLVLPLPLLYCWLTVVFPYYLLVIINIYIVYWALALNSLELHGKQIYRSLQDNNLKQAQHYCSYIVSRDTRQLDQKAISRATTESMLENGHDAVTATLIYFVIGGAPLVIIHRLSNTLDAMWGYRSEQFNYFGKFSARLDDLLGFISGKITALLFALLGGFSGKFTQILSNAYWQSKHYKSHNGGWVMASGATLINVRLGGKAIYFGKEVESPPLGEGEQVQSKHIKNSLTVVKQAVVVWLIMVFIMELYLR